MFPMVGVVLAPALSSPKHVPTQANSTSSTLMSAPRREDEYPQPSHRAEYLRGAPGIVRKQITLVADARPRPSRCLGRAAVRWIETCLRRASWTPLSQIPAAWQPCAPWQGTSLRAPVANENPSATSPRAGLGSVPHNRSAEPRRWAGVLPFSSQP